MIFRYIFKIKKNKIGQCVCKPEFDGESCETFSGVPLLTLLNINSNQYLSTDNKGKVISYLFFLICVIFENCNGINIYDIDYQMLQVFKCYLELFASY